jgi:hypothetical protein
MSAETIIAQLEADFSNLSSAGKAFLISLTSRVTALENTLQSTAAGPLAQTFSDVSASVNTILSAGATAAASANNPATLVVAIGAVAAPVTQALAADFNEAKGFIEGLTGNTPAAGASTAEVDGAASGAAVKNIWDAFVDDIEMTIHPAANSNTPPPATN